MIFYIAMAFAVIAALALTLFFIDDVIESWWGAIISFVFITPIAFGCTAIIMLGFTASLFIPFNKHMDADGDTVEYLQAVQMGEGIQGQFFLGSGVISEENVFTYYAKSNTGAFRSGRINADYAEIIESNTEKPRIVTHHFYFSQWIITKKWQESLDFDGANYTIYVPVGSVKPLVDMSLPK